MRMGKMFCATAAALLTCGMVVSPVLPAAAEESPASSAGQETSSRTGDDSSLNVEEAQRKVDEAQKQADKAQEDADTAQKAYDDVKNHASQLQSSRGVRGLMESIANDSKASSAVRQDAKNALDVLLGKADKPSWYEQYVALGQAGGPDSPEALEETLGYYGPINSLRTGDGLSSLDVSLTAVAESAVSSFYAAQAGETDRWYDGLENIALGPYRAYTGGDSAGTLDGALHMWYDMEKPKYDDAVAAGSYRNEPVDSAFLTVHRHDAAEVAAKYPRLYQATSHYLNIVDSGARSMGFAVDHNSRYKGAVVWHGDSAQGSLSVNEYRTIVSEYLSDSAKAITAAQRDLQTKKTELEQASKNLEQANAALDQAKKDLQNAKNSQGEAGTVDAKPVYRLYNPLLKLHLYTADEHEKTVLSAGDWTYEQISFKVSEKQTEGSKPVYRLYNPGTYRHLLTMDSHERDVLSAPGGGWNYENVAWYQTSSGTIPVYRMYSPVTNEHLYTTDVNEYAVNATRGWNPENVAWNGLS